MLNSTNKKAVFSIYIGVGLMAAIIGICFRLYPLLAFTTNESEDRAAMYVLGTVRSKIAKQVEANYPQLNQTQKEILIKKEMDQILHQEGQNIRITIDRIAHSMGTTKTGHTTPYLLESDPFYYYQLTENIVKTGKMSDTVKGSKCSEKICAGG